ncbi:MAG: acyloxyacyl hydrolase [Chlorobiaceae bacterium]|nr:acyloxyacyl hydrolase [Chlorobiaceae bacterium]
MKKPLFHLVSVLMLLLVSFPSRAKAEGVHLDEIAIGSGYAWGHMKFTEATNKVVPIFVRVGFNMNSVFGMQNSKGTLQLALEPFCNPVIEPESGVETGLDVFFRYHHPVAPSVKLVAEVGSGPMYLGIDSREQGDKGFNFLNQFGLATRFDLSEHNALTLGYRFRHISNAGTSHPNRGINTNAVVLSYSLLY